MNTSPPIRMIFHLPREPDGSVLIQGKQSPWKLLYATQDKVKSLGPEWAVRGIYLLFGPGQNPGNYWVRVGKSAPGTLRKRVPSHVKNPKINGYWSHALLVCSTVGNGFNSADAGYLEGALANLLDNAPQAELYEGQRDQDDTLETWELDELEPVIELVLAVMRVLGYSPDQNEEIKDSKSLKRSPAQSRFSIGDLIDAGLLVSGNQLKPAPKQFDQIAFVKEDGTIEVEGEIFTAPSPAAEKIVGRPTNGWTFWTVNAVNGKTVKLADLRKQLSEGKVTKSEEALKPSVSSDSNGPLMPLIEAKIIKPGDKLVAVSKGETHRATVTTNGWVEHEGKTFAPSTIAKLLAGYPVSGWDFWRLDTETRSKLSDLKKKLKSS